MLRFNKTIIGSLAVVLVASCLFAGVKCYGKYTDINDIEDEEELCEIDAELYEDEEVETTFEYDLEEVVYGCDDETESCEEDEVNVEYNYEDEEEDFGYCEDVVCDEDEGSLEDVTEEETECLEATEHECNSWINESEFDDGTHVWECEECGATEYWSYLTDEDDFDPEDHECTEFTDVDNEGYKYCVECGAGFCEE